METHSQMKNSTIINKILITCSGVLALFLFWIILSSAKQNEFIYPSIGKVFSSLFSILTNPETLKIVLLTLSNTLLVCLLSIVISLVISYLFFLSNYTYYFFKPLIVLLKSAPLALIIIYIWIVLGNKRAPFFITLLMTLPICIEGFISSIKEIDKNVLMALQVEDISRTKKFIKVIIPMILPYIIMTYIQSFGLGLKVMIMGEYICQTPSSLGEYLYAVKMDLNFSEIIAFIILIAFIVMVMELLIRLVSKKLSKRQ